VIRQETSTAILMFNGTSAQTDRLSLEPCDADWHSLLRWPTEPEHLTALQNHNNCNMTMQTQDLGGQSTNATSHCQTLVAKNKIAHIINITQRLID